MSEASPVDRQPTWAEQFGFKRLFSSFRHANNINKLILSFCGVVLTYSWGRLLDVVWVTSHKVAAGVGMTEAAIFVASGGNRPETLEWIKSLGSDAERSGVFAVLLSHFLTSVNQLISAVLSVSPDAFLSGLRNFVLTLIWLVSLHPVYALFFVIGSLKIWALFGGAISRAAALDAARQERITLAEAVSFARSKWLSFVMAPLLPISIAVVAGVAIFLMGLIGWIPYIGEVIVGIFLLPIAILFGIAVALFAIGLVGAFGLIYPNIAVEGSDCFDPLGRLHSYVFYRPWRTAVYYLCVMAHGAVCLAFIKLVARLALWAAHLFLGFSMNWGSPSVASESSEGVSKLNAIWQTPALTGETTFYGSFGEVELAGMSAFAQFFFKCWIYGVWGIVGAYAMSYFFCANTNIYLLLRREVDMTDVEDVYLDDDAAATASIAAPAESGDKPKGSGGVSLPVVGS
ncbi:hypothetical protein B7486_10990 [cyanobacterium TDX16]|nr:hypothetical protein B7486_10990 [cyanobacterium TDX16]